MKSDTLLPVGTVLTKGARRFEIQEHATMPGANWRSAYRIRELGDGVKGSPVSLTPAKGLKYRFTILLPNDKDEGAL